MIYLLRAKELTVSQIAETLNKTPQAIYHQIKILLETGLVEVAKEERVEHFIETYYRATAEVFELSHGTEAGHELASGLKEAIEALKRVGIELEISDELVTEMAEIERRVSLAGLSSELEEKISGLEDAGFHTRQYAYKYLQMAMMSDKQFDQMQADERKLR